MNPVKKITRLIKDIKATKRLMPAEEDLLKEIKRKKLTYLSNSKLVGIVETAKELESENVPGLFLEAGCALGGSSILLSTIKDTKRGFYIYDVFDMIPPPTPDDTPDVHERYESIQSGVSKGIDGDKYYGYEENLYEKVINNFSEFNLNLEKESIFLIKGLIQDTLVVDQDIAFAHIDVDWYEPVLISLQRIFPKLSVGGVIILDDYYDWGGCRKATDEFLQEVKGQYDLSSDYGSLKITRTEL